MGVYAEAVWVVPSEGGGPNLLRNSAQSRLKWPSLPQLKQCRIAPGEGLRLVFGLKPPRTAVA